ncbi:uncharacterized protein LOC131882155 [Tigriopus californicus]|uniref:uncharacterized protein LOC131882155 n=1 Tax=Tigriopus californicus TaxID=6832 RepID=UPI0027DA537F|nr:uncharacterized protein LOC131882155 [Tigriopus californicus]
MRWLQSGIMSFMALFVSTASQINQNQTKDLWQPEIEPELRKREPSNGIPGYQDLFSARQNIDGSALANSESAAMIALALGGALALGLGLGDAEVRRATLKADLDAANAKIAALEAKTNAGCSDLQTVVSTLRAAATLLLTANQNVVVVGPVITPRQLPIIPGNDLDTFLNQFLGPLPTTVCT